MRRRTKYAIALAAVLTLIAGVAGAGWTLPPPNPYVSWITFDDPALGYTNKLTATVTQNDNGSYHYSYVFEFQQSFLGLPLSDFSVGNMLHRPFTNPQCSAPATFNGTLDSLYWYPTDLWPGTTVEFSFDSYWSYDLVNVTAGGGGMPSGGTTLGMVPEPASTVAMVLGVTALWAKLKRKRR